MQLARLQRPFQRVAGAVASASRPLGALSRPTTTSLEDRFASLRIASPTEINAAVQGKRYATVKSQGAYKLKSKKTIPKKLGAKRTGDQYVLPGNIIYKQRGTVWHPGENTIMGRDHTIHAAVAGYVKYYRDPHRHPGRQYIGVAFNRDDKLPYPPGSPRKRKLNLVAVPQKEEKRSEEVISPSGIPLTVTRLPESEQSTESEDSTTTGVSVTAQTTVTAKPKLPIHLRRRIPLKDGNSVIARLIQQKLRARAITKAKQDAWRLQQQKELEARMNTRVFRLQDDYSYRETNWEIGRLIGDAGTIPGTEKTESRRARMRSRRKKRAAYFRELKARRVAKARRREESKRRLREKRAVLLAQRREATTTVKATNEAVKVAAEKNKVKA